MSRSQELARASWIMFVVVLAVDLFWPLVGSGEVMFFLDVMLWLSGLSLGIAALVLRRGAAGVVASATVGIGLNGVPLAYVALMLVRLHFGR